MMNILHRPANLFVQNIAAHATGALLVATSAFIFLRFLGKILTSFPLPQSLPLGLELRYVVRSP
jgi:hypothetical protein